MIQDSSLTRCAGMLHRLCLPDCFFFTAEIRTDGIHPSQGAPLAM